MGSEMIVLCISQMTVKMENMALRTCSCHNIQDTMPQHELTSYITVPPM